MLAVALLAACAPPPPPPPPTPVPPPLPQRVIPATRTPVPTATPEPTATRVPQRALSPAELDPFWGLYASEQDGLFVTTRHPRGRYYYRWDDRRWFALPDRVWFRSAEDLLTVFPGREPAP